MHFCPLQGAKLHKITDICKFYPQKIIFYLHFFHFLSIHAALKQHFYFTATKNLPMIGGSLCIAAEIISRVHFHARGV